MWILLLPLVHTELPVDAIITVGYMILHSYFFFLFSFSIFPFGIRLVHIFFLVTLRCSSD